MEKIRTIWPTLTVLAEDLGIAYTTVHSWFARGRIPADHDLDIIAAAERRGHVLTLFDLAEARREARQDRGAA